MSAAILDIKRKFINCRNAHVNVKQATWESWQNKICKRIKIYATLVPGIKRRRKGWKIFAHGKKNNQIYNFVLGIEDCSPRVEEQHKAEIAVTMTRVSKNVDWIKKLSETRASFLSKGSCDIRARCEKLIWFDIVSQLKNFRFFSSPFLFLLFYINVDFFSSGLAFWNTIFLWIKKVPTRYIWKWKRRNCASIHENNLSTIIWCAPYSFHHLISPSRFSFSTLAQKSPK